MYPRSMFRLVGFLPLIVSALDFDSTWSLGYDLFADAGSSLDQRAVTLNPGGVVLDQQLAVNPIFDNPFSSDSFEALFDDSLPPIDDIVWNAPFEVADCATSEYNPVVGTSRIKRSEGATSCRNSMEAPALPRITPEGASEPMTATDVLTTDDTNSFCIAYTQGILPWGVCAARGGLAGTTVLHGIQYSVYFVNPCTLGMLDCHRLLRLR